MKQTSVAMGLFFMLGPLAAGAVETGADDAPAIHVAMQPQRDVIAEDGAVNSFSPTTPVTQVP